MKNKQKLTRPYQRIIRFSYEENEYIKRKIEASPFNNFQNFARLLLLTGELKLVDYSELHTLNGEVNRIGNNINQLTKLAHQFDDISPDDIQELTTMISELKILVANKLKEELKAERRR